MNRIDKAKGVGRGIARIVTEYLPRMAGALSAMILASMVLLILVEMVLRSIFDTSTYIAAEFVGYGVGAVTFLSLADTFRVGGHIRVSLLLHRLRGLSRRLLEAICTVATLFATAFLGWFFWLRVSQDWERGTESGGAIDVPMWLPKGILLVGLILFLLYLIVHLLRVLNGSVFSAESGEHEGEEA